MTLKGTTICAVQEGRPHRSIAGDGQVTMGAEHHLQGAPPTRFAVIYGGTGRHRLCRNGLADAFALCDTL